jgi:Uma2 family endonuclease
MNVIHRTRGMTQAEFFDWAEAQNTRYEFNGIVPVARTGGSLDHNRIALNIYVALRERLTGSGCTPFGMDAGVQTIGDAVRYPDALVTCSKADGAARLVPHPVVVFEVLSPGSGRTDRIDKVREYHAIASVRRYVILEYAGIGLTVLARAGATDPWIATSLMAEDILRMPEIGSEIPVAEFYADTDLADAPPSN